MIDAERDIFDRTWEILAQWKHEHPEYGTPVRRRIAAPFGFVKPPPLRWRVSCDVYEQLLVHVDQVHAFHPLGAQGITVDDTLYSIYLIHECDVLPPNSVILEPTP